MRREPIFYVIEESKGSRDQCYCVRGNFLCLELKAEFFEAKSTNNCIKQRKSIRVQRQIIIEISKRIYCVIHINLVDKMGMQSQEPKWLCLKAKNHSDWIDIIDNSSFRIF